MALFPSLCPSPLFFLFLLFTSVQSKATVDLPKNVNNFTPASIDIRFYSKSTNVTLGTRIAQGRFERPIFDTVSLALLVQGEAQGRAGPKRDGCVDHWSAPNNRSWVALLPVSVGCSGQDAVDAAISLNVSAIVVYYSDVTLQHFDQHNGNSTMIVQITSEVGTEIESLLDSDTNALVTISRANLPIPLKVNKTSVMFVSVSFIVLMVISLAWLVFYYIQRFRYINAKDRLQKHLSNAAKKAVSKIPVASIKAGDKEIVTEESCAVCIEPYAVGDNIRVLPCRHEFHKSCVDPWLLEHRTCPMCKMDILRHFGYTLSGSEGSDLHVAVDDQRLPATHINNININGINILPTLGSPEPPPAFTVVETEASVNREAPSPSSTSSPTHQSRTSSVSSSSSSTSSTHPREDSSTSSSPEPPLASPDVFPPPLDLPRERPPLDGSTTAPQPPNNSFFRSMLDASRTRAAIRNLARLSRSGDKQKQVEDIGGAVDLESAGHQVPASPSTSGSSEADGGRYNRRPKSVSALGVHDNIPGDSSESIGRFSPDSDLHRSRPPSDHILKKAYDLQFCDVDSVDSHEFTDALEDITPQPTPKPTKRARRTSSKRQGMRNGSSDLLRVSNGSSRRTAKRPTSLCDQGLGSAKGEDGRRGDDKHSLSPADGYFNSTFKSDEKDDDDDELPYYSPKLSCDNRSARSSDSIKASNTSSSDGKKKPKHLSSRPGVHSNRRRTSKIAPAAAAPLGGSFIDGPVVSKPPTKGRSHSTNRGVSGMNLEQSHQVRPVSSSPASHVTRATTSDKLDRRNNKSNNSNSRTRSNSKALGCNYGTKVDSSSEPTAFCDEEYDPTLRDMRHSLSNSKLSAQPTTVRHSSENPALSSRVRASQSVSGLSSYANQPNVRRSSQVTSSHPSLLDDPLSAASSQKRINSLPAHQAATQLYDVPLQRKTDLSDLTDRLVNLSNQINMNSNARPITSVPKSRYSIPELRKSIHTVPSSNKIVRQSSLDASSRFERMPSRSVSIDVDCGDSKYSNPSNNKCEYSSLHNDRKQDENVVAGSSFKLGQQRDGGATANEVTFSGGRKFSSSRNGIISVGSSELDSRRVAHPPRGGPPQPPSSSTQLYHKVSHA